MNSIRSMTAFTAVQKNTPEGQLSISIRSVNSRYLDLSFTFSEGIDHLEPVLARILKAKINRGKIECAVSFKANAQGALRINENLLEALASKLNTVNQVVPQGSTNLMEVLNFPGLLLSQNSDQNSINKILIDGFKEAVYQFDQNRLAEGNNLKLALEDKLEQIQHFLDELKSYLANLTQIERTRLMDRIASMQLTLDPSRIEQEVALLAQKSDIAEEHDRLRSHVQTVNTILHNTDKVHGKRLDFMMQELAREANTIASKAGTLNITNISVELKVLIEQMREQIQNIE